MDIYRNALVEAALSRFCDRLLVDGVESEAAAGVMVSAANPIADVRVELSRFMKVKVLADRWSVEFLLPLSWGDKIASCVPENTRVYLDARAYAADAIRWFDSAKVDLATVMLLGNAFAAVKVGRE